MMENVSINFGPIKQLMDDNTISEVMVNRFDKIFVEKAGKIHPVPTSFANEKALVDLIVEIARFSGRELDAKRPYLDGYLPDGSRANAVFPPMAPGGSCLTIRKFRKSPYTLQDFIKNKSLSEKAAFFLHACVIARVNIVVSGGTGTGKTTLLNTLATLIPEGQRIITIEDTAEINLQHPNWVRMESVNKGSKSEGTVTIKDCLSNALRMRPDRIIIGECRRDETFEMLQAMNTGHDGSMTTLHSNSPRDCLLRIESLIMTSNVDIPLSALRRQMASAIDLIVQLRRNKNGERVVSEITELTGMEQTNITSQLVFQRDKNKGNNELLASGLVPTFLDKFTEAGVQLPQNFFEPNTRVTYQPD